MGTWRSFFAVGTAVPSVRLPLFLRRLYRPIDQAMEKMRQVSAGSKSNEPLTKEAVHFIDLLSF
ncbi:MAG: hypothetical protein DME42_12220 [Verrucomicrobia bacterium]|nr:MAG: hypothetical protein DME42_12220 [Verrucomicrobiota bacterium]